MDIKISYSRLFWGSFLLILIFVPFLYYAWELRPSIGGDFRGFLIAGNRFFAGEFLYNESRVATNVTWPPFFSVFILPFSLIGQISIPLSQFVWYLLNMIVLVLTLDVWMRFCTGKGIRILPDGTVQSLWSLPVLLTLLMVLVPWFKMLEALQMNLIVLYLMSLSLYLGSRQKEWSAGFLLGFAIAIKAFPILIAPWFLFRRQYKIFIITCFAGGLLTLFPIIRYGPETYFQMLLAWIEIGLSGGYPINGLNQSIYAMVGRYIALNPFDHLGERLFAPDKGTVEAILMTWTHRGLLVAFYAWFGFQMLKKYDKNPAVSAAIFILIALLFSPLAWRNYFIISLPGFFILNIFLNSGKDNVSKYIVWTSFFLMSGLLLIAETDKVVKSFILTVLSNMTTAVLLLLAGLNYIYSNYSSDLSTNTITSRTDKS